MRRPNMTTSRVSNRTVEEMSYDEWCRYLDMLIEDEEESLWSIGDAWYRRHDCAKTAEEQAREFKKPYQTLKKLGWNSKVWPEVLRRTSLTHSHHVALGGLMSEKWKGEYRSVALELLDRCEKGNGVTDPTTGCPIPWTLREFKKEIRLEKERLHLVKPKHRMKPIKVDVSFKPTEGIHPAKFLEGTLQGIGKLLRSNHFEKITEQLGQLDLVDREQGAKGLRDYATDMLKIAECLWPSSTPTLMTIDGEASTVEQ